MFTIYYSDVTGVPSNCSYPHKKLVTDEGSLKEAISHDYVCAEYKNSYRNGDNFIGSDCIPVDCDNDHSDNPEDWITPAIIREAFPDVSFAIHYSRSNNKEKNGKSARPKFHVLFPIDYETDATKYKDIKLRVNSIFPYFDTNALDSVRFFFGTKEAEVEIYQGSINLTEYLNSDEFENMEMNKMPESLVIKEGSRNSTLSHFAGRVIKKYGDTEKAYEVFMEKAALCDPPLEDEELVSIWNSAKKFYKKLSNQEGYVDPEQYNQDFLLEPLDYSDVGQATVLAKEYENIMTTYFPVSVEQLRKNCKYDESSNSYEYEMIYASPYPPFGEVVDYTENADGTITLIVDGVWPDYNSDLAFRNKIVVQPFGDGTFRYLSNSIEQIELELPPIARRKG